MRSENAPYPVGPTGKDAVPITAASGNVAAATATATLAAGGANFLTYITGFEVTAGGATAAATVNVTVTNTPSGTLTYCFSAATGVDAPSPPLIVEFNPPIPANALNTAIVVSMPTLGTGNAHAAIVAHGFQLPFSS